MTREDFAEYKKGSWDAFVCQSCTSTFDVAREKIANGAAHGDMIVCDVQTGGKGRQGRKWMSPAGGLWMGIILKPDLELSMLSSVTLLCAVAVCRAMEGMFLDVSPKIKWPNDIYIDDKKICGILTETILENKKAEYVVVGIGINANNDIEEFENEIDNTAISFKKLGLHVCRQQMAANINDTLLDLMMEYEKQRDLSFILEYYHSRMLWMGQQAAMKNTVTGEVSQRGKIAGIDTEGRLILQSDKGAQKIVSGELSLRRK